VLQNKLIHAVFIEYSKSTLVLYVRQLTETTMPSLLGLVGCPQLFSTVCCRPCGRGCRIPGSAHL